MSTQKKKCIRCGKTGNFSCSKCRAVSYCGPECQKIHWTSGHKGECKVLQNLNEPKKYIDSGDKSAVTEPTKSLKNSSEDVPSGMQESQIPASNYLFPTKRVEQMMRFRPDMVNVGIGFANAGNSCYLNSVLQCFIYTLPLSNYLLSRAHSPQCKVKPRFCMMCELEELATNILTQAREGWMLPRNVLCNLKNLGGFVLYQQEDAHDFAYCVLGALQSSMIQSLDRKPSIKEEETSLIYQLFGGYIQSEIKCENCGYRSNTYESFLDLKYIPASSFFTLLNSVEISVGASVEEALQKYTDIEHMGADIGCKKVSTAQKQLTVHKSPNLLFLNLKRFEATGAKINTPVVFRTDLSLKKVMSRNSKDDHVYYELYAVIVHFGASMFLGHYVAFIKVLDTWYLFDDDKVIPVDESVVLRQHTYLLFYKKDLEVSIEDESKIIARRQAAKPKSKSTKDMPDISSSSNATSSIIRTPKHHLYYRQDDNSNIIDLVLLVELPLLVSLNNVSLQVMTGGSVDLDASPHKLKINFPFTINVEEAQAQFYGSNGTMVVTLPVTNNAPEKTRQVTILVNESKLQLESLNIDPENEVTVQEAETKTVSKPKAEEATYGKLYRDIQSQDTALDLKSVKKTTKIGRNDDCPCGSGKKYKKCHGK